MKPTFNILSLAMIFVLLTSALGLTTTPAQAAPSWEVVGISGFSSAITGYSSIAAENGIPYVVYADADNGGKASVMKYDADSGNWVAVGGLGFSANSIDYPRIAVDNAVPYVAYPDWGDGGKATVMKFDALSGNWLTVGLPGFSAGRASSLSLKVGNSTLYVAYKDWGNGGKATVMKFDGSAWVAVGTPGFSAGSADLLSIAIDNGTVYAGYQDWTNNGKATVMKYTGTAWSTVGAPSFTTRMAAYLSLAVDNDIPYVAYQDADNGYKASVMKFDTLSGNWVTVGTPGFTAAMAAYTSLAIDNEVLYVAYRDDTGSYKANVMKFDVLSGSWITVGAAGFSADRADSISFAVDQGTLYTAFQDWANNYKTTVMRFVNDRTPPNAPVLTAPPALIADTRPTLQGTAEPNSLIDAWYVDDNNNPVQICQDIPVDLSGNWSCELSAELPEREIELTVNATDEAGNTSSDTSYFFTIDLTTWEILGTPGFSSEAEWFTSLALDQGTPYVAYQDWDKGNKATVMKFDALSGDWVTVGMPGFSAGKAVLTSIALNDGTPYVAYIDPDNYNMATVMKYDSLSGNWLTVGPQGFSPRYLNDLAFAIDQGTPYVAYTSQTDGYKATLMKFDADSGNWITVGAAGFSAGEADYLSLAIEDGTPYVAYADYPDGSQATVMKYDSDSGNWITVGAAGFSAAEIDDISLAVDSGIPYVAYADNSGKATVMKFDALSGEWTDVGTPGFTPGTVAAPSLVFDNGIPYLAFEDGSDKGRASVMKFDSLLEEWVSVGAASFSVDYIAYLSFAVEAGVPYVAYKDLGNNGKATVMKLSDKIPPDAPVVTAPSELINDATPSIQGTAEPDSFINVGYFDDSHHLVAVCQNIQVDGSGNWSCVSSASLPEREIELAVNATDTSGNTSGDTAYFFTVDLTPPDEPVVEAPNGSTNDDTPTISGTAEPESLIKAFYWDGTSWVSVCQNTLADELGNWSCLASLSLPAGHTELAVNATDAAGNQSSNASYSFTVIPMSSGQSAVDVYIHGDAKGHHILPSNTGTRQSYESVSDGPVKIAGTNTIVLTASERVIYKVNSVNTSFTEMMALPDSQLDTTYWLPWYNNVDLDTQLRFANVTDGQTATVHLYINDKEIKSGCSPSSSPYTLLPGASLRVSCSGVNNGPVKIESDQKIVAAERVIYKVKNVDTSFSEMMALPSSQLDKTYWLPWYNNVDLDTQLRVANVTNTSEAATVNIYIHGQEVSSSCTPKGPYTLTAGASLRVSCRGINNGPVKIKSTQPIVASERVIYKVNKVNTSFTEMMALPDRQLDTTYWLPWYNNVDWNTQLRLANVTPDQTATVRLYFHGQEVTSGCTPSNGPYILKKGESVRVSCTGINDGPMQIESDVPIVVSERVIYTVNKRPTSFSEMMALPNGQLDDIYWLPWYNNVGLNTQLRFGIP